MSIYLWILALIPSVLSSLWTSDIVRKCNYKLRTRKKLAGRFGRYNFVRGDKFLSAISFGLPARACENSRSCSCDEPEVATTFEKMRDVAFCLVSSYRRFKHQKKGKETISEWARAYKLSLSTVGSQSSFNMDQWAEAAAFLVFLREQGYLNADEFPKTCKKVFPGTKGKGYRFFDFSDVLLLPILLNAGHNLGHTAKSVFAASQSSALELGKQSDRLRNLPGSIMDLSFLTDNPLAKVGKTIPSSSSLIQKASEFGSDALNSARDAFTGVTPQAAVDAVTNALPGIKPASFVRQASQFVNLDNIAHEVSSEKIVDAAAHVMELVSDTLWN